MLCRSVNRNSFACSRADMPVAAAATAIVCRLIIFPITPPTEFAAAISTGSNPNRPALTTCKFPNSLFDGNGFPTHKTKGRRLPYQGMGVDEPAAGCRPAAAGSSVASDHLRALSKLARVFQTLRAHFSPIWANWRLATPISR